MKCPLAALVVGLLVIGACSRDPSPALLPSNQAAKPTPPPRVVSAVETLDRLDARAPLPLLPVMAQHQKQNMRDHLVAVQEIVAALANRDFAAAERAAGRIGTSDSMQQMCTHMGSGAPGFAEQALEFHRNADRIGAAARDQAHDRVLTELASTLQACTNCHATWKQQVVDESTWQKLASGNSHR